MSWEKVEVEKPHYCEKPILASEHPELSRGDVIRCTDCGQHWIYEGTDSGMQWDPYPPVIRWRRTAAPGTGRIQGR